jgi:hypothetical protein
MGAIEEGKDGGALRESLITVSINLFFYGDGLVSGNPRAIHLLVLTFSSLFWVPLQDFAELRRQRP